MSVVKMASEGFVEGKLAGKADKSTTYTKTEINDIIETLETGSRQIVQELPASGDPMVIYMVPKSTSQTNNSYDEYIWTAAGAWEKIGDTEIDLSDYYTKDETDDLLDDKADKVTNATTGNLAALDANGNLVDSEKGPDDFVQIGETNTQPYDESMEGLVYPLFSVEAGYYNSESGEWVQNALMTFGADEIQTNSSTGSAIFRPDEVIVYNEASDATSTMTGSSVETPLLYTGALWGQNGYGIGDIELSEYCSVHTPYDESTGGYAYQAAGTEIIRAGSDYEAGTLGPLLDLNFGSSYGTIGYPDPYTGDTTWATVQSVVSAANGWNDGYPVVYALTVDNYGTLALNGGSIEFQDPVSGTSYYLGVSDAIRIGSLNTGYWVYDEYDPGTGGYSEQQIDATDIASIIDTYVNSGFVMTGSNYVQSGQSSLFSVVSEYSYETVFTGQTVEIGYGGSVYTVVSDSGVTAPSLELNDGNGSESLNYSELVDLKTAYKASVNGDTLELSPVISQSQI